MSTINFWEWKGICRKMVCALYSGLCGRHSYTMHARGHYVFISRLVIFNTLVVNICDKRDLRPLIAVRTSHVYNTIPFCRLVLLLLFSRESEIFYLIVIAVDIDPIANRMHAHLTQYVPSIQVQPHKLFFS